MFDVSCVGILCADVLIKPVDDLPEPGKLAVVDRIQLELGGCASNAAVDLSKLGLRTQLAGKTGDDGFGIFLRNILVKNKVNIDGLGCHPTIPTSSSVVHIDSDGERTVLHCPGANAHFQYEDLDLEQITDAKLLFIAGTFLMPAFDGSDAVRLLQTARKKGLVCCMDTAWDFSGQWMRKIKMYLPFLDWFMPSRDEAEQLSECTDPRRMAAAFKELGAVNVVIKLGKDGCFVSEKGLDGYYMSATSSDRPIDTAGAGDAFCAGFITGLIKEWPIEDTACFANAVAYHCIRSVGTTTGIQDIETILNTMQKYDQVR